MLFRCDRAKLIWRALGLHEIMASMHTNEKLGVEILEMVLCDPTNQKNYMSVVDVPEMLAVTCWYIWWQRRSITHDEDVQPPMCTAAVVQALALNFVKASTKPRPRRGPVVG